MTSNEQETAEGPYTPENPAPGSGYQKSVGLAPHTAYSEEKGYGTIPPRARVNGVGITALVLSLIAFLLSWIPLVNILAIVLGMTAVICGIVGIRRKLMAKGPSAWGIAVGSLSIIVSGLILIASIAFLGTLQSEMGEAGLSFEEISQKLESGENPADIIDESTKKIEREMGVGGESENGSR